MLWRLISRFHFNFHCLSFYCQTTFYTLILLGWIVIIKVAFTNFDSWMSLVRVIPYWFHTICCLSIFQGPWTSGDEFLGLLYPLLKVYLLIKLRFNDIVLYFTFSNLVKPVFILESPTLLDRFWLVYLDLALLLIDSLVVIYLNLIFILSLLR